MKVYEAFFLTPSQDEKLKKLVEQHGTDSWKLIANLFPVSIMSCVQVYNVMSVMSVKNSI